MKINYSKTFGIYFIVISIISLVTLIISWVSFYWTDYINLDFSFILWFLLGKSLLKRKPSARIISITITSVFSLLMIIAFITGKAEVNFFSILNKSDNFFYYIIISVIWLVFSFPGIFLIQKSAKDEFVTSDMGNK